MIAKHKSKNKKDNEFNTIKVISKVLVKAVLKQHVPKKQQQHIPIFI
jgi:hypothetical protein